MHGQNHIKFVCGSVLESCSVTNFSRPVWGVDRKASNAKELLSGLVMVNKQTQGPNRGTSVR